MRKHFFDENFFDSIDTPEKAYWLGFITADGCVIYTNKNKVLNLKLAKKDLGHLSKFAKSIGYNTILERPVLNLYSKKLTASLISHGITPRKTFTVKCWEGPLDLQKDYWRGVFDGDGCICFHDKKRKNGTIYRQWRASLVGNKNIVNSFKDFVENCGTGDYKKAVVIPHQSIWSVSYGGIRPCQTIHNLIYKNPVVCLERKLEKFLMVNETKLKEPIIAHLTNDILLPLYEKYKNWSKVARHLNVSHNGMYKHARKLGLL